MPANATSEKMTAPRVSIGMPVYNGALWIEPTIDSILGQSYTDIELVISDNCSSDATEQICRRYAQRDSRVKYYRNANNIGVSNNYNAAFLHSTGEYFKWNSASDICAPAFIAQCVAVLEARPDVVLCYPRIRLFEGDIAHFENYQDDFDLESDDVCERFIKFVSGVRLNNAMNGVMRATALRNTELYQKFVASDVNMMAELMLYGKGVQLPDYLFYRRMQPETATRYQTAEQVLRYYDPHRQSLMLFQNWKKFTDPYALVRKAPLSVSAKWRLYRFLARRLWWHRNVLASDLFNACWVLTRIPRKGESKS